MRATPDQNGCGAAGRGPGGYTPEEIEGMVPPAERGGFMTPLILGATCRHRYNPVSEKNLAA